MGSGSHGGSSRSLRAPSASTLAPSFLRCTVLEQKGWLSAEWGRSETNRKARFYALTAAGRRHAEDEARNWKRVSFAIELALRDEGEEWS